MRDLLEDLLAVGPLHATAMAAKALHRTALVVGDTDRIGQRFGALAGRDSLGERDLATAVLAVGQQDQGLAASLLFHDLIGGEIDSVVERSTHMCGMVLTTWSAA